MAVLLSDIINQTQRLLDPTPRYMSVTLNGSYTAGAPSITFTDTSAGSTNTGSIIPGVILSVELELFLVTGSPVGGVVSVVPGYLGSTQANHASGTLGYVRRRYTDFECMSQINNVLDELSSEGLYNLGTCELTYNPVSQGYDLTDDDSGNPVTGFIEGVSLRYKTPTPDRKYGTIPSRSWEVLPNMSDDTDFPSGYCLILNGDAWPGQPMLFNYKQAFTHFAAYTDNAQTKALLAPSMNDLLPLGAMLRMVPPREVIRNQTQAQPDGRLATEVPPGAIGSSVNAVRATYEMRIGQEKARLKRNIGHMRRRY